MRIIADDLWFPEGPVSLPDGGWLVVEIRRQALTRIYPDGQKQPMVIGGGPNGAAMGPDGQAYVCNNGGFKFVRRADGRMVTAGQADDYVTGRIDRVDIETGKVERLYDKVDGEPIRGPNDIVFDAHGGFYFTDPGKTRHRDADRGCVCYARADGSMVRQVIFPISRPNGVGLSPDGKTLYVTETETARLWAWDVIGPGELAYQPAPSPHGGRFIYGSPTYCRFDSLAVEASGNVCAGTLDTGGITVISPQGERVEFVNVEGDTHVTNICFGGNDLRTAYLTLSYAGLLLETNWHRPGLQLNY